MLASGCAWLRLQMGVFGPLLKIVNGVLRCNRYCRSNTKRFAKIGRRENDRREKEIKETQRNCDEDYIWNKTTLFPKVYDISCFVFGGLWLPFSVLWPIVLPLILYFFSESCKSTSWATIYSSHNLPIHNSLYSSGSKSPIWPTQLRECHKIIICLCRL